jgi:hypothetical protein
LLNLPGEQYVSSPFTQPHSSSGAERNKGDKIMKTEKKIKIREDLILVRLKIRSDNAHYYEYFKNLKKEDSPETDIERDRRYK